MSSLVVQNLSVCVEGRDVVSDVSLAINAGEIHALMGPNGSGKSSLGYAVAGHPAYEVVDGSITLGGENLLPLSPEERAKRGLFLSFQEPPEVGGVSLNVFLSTIAVESNSQLPTPNSQLSDPKETLCRLGLSEQFLHRFLNEGFSGGEKKKSEILQFLARTPKVAIFDEVDTGLDVDALEAVASILHRAARSGCGILLISHSPRLLQRLEPQHVHILLQGRMVQSGGKNLLSAVERSGYRPFEGISTRLSLVGDTLSLGSEKEK